MTEQSLNWIDLPKETKWIRPSFVKDGVVDGQQITKDPSYEVLPEGLKYRDIEKALAPYAKLGLLSVYNVVNGRPYNHPSMALLVSNVISYARPLRERAQAIGSVFGDYASMHCRAGDDHFVDGFLHKMFRRSCSISWFCRCCHISGRVLVYTQAFGLLV